MKRILSLFFVVVINLINPLQVHAVEPYPCPAGEGIARGHFMLIVVCNGGRANVVKVDTLTNKVTDISQSSVGQNIQPQWSPNGQYIAFASNRDGNWEIYVAKANGQSLQRMTYNNTITDQSPMWSPDGKNLAFMTTNTKGNINIEIVDLSTGVQSRITDSPENERLVAWKDAKNLYFTTDYGEVFEVNVVNLTKKLLN
jgi:Tol biopolymer transport system component